MRLSVAKFWECRPWWGRSQLLGASRGGGVGGLDVFPPAPIPLFPHSLDSDQKDQLIEVIEKLLADKTTVSRAPCLPSPKMCPHQAIPHGDVTIPTKPASLWRCHHPSEPPRAFPPQLVAGSVVMAFEEVCPERIDLIHKNYRKLCNLLIDVEEWGQVVIINMLTRYARTQFLSPNQNVSLGASGCPGHLGVPLATLVPGMLQDKIVVHPVALPLWLGWGGGVKVSAAGRSPCWRRAPRRLSMALRKRTPRMPRRRQPRWPSASPMSWTLTTACSCATPNPCCRAATLR